ncbi:MAG: NirA family protein [Pirellulaceae bacterium]|nr:NirA family protein [Pirellulaceae bacterium]
MGATSGFSKEQQAYLQGLVLGTDVARKINNLPVLSGSGAASTIQIGASTPAAHAAKGHLTTLHALAQQRCESSGKKLVAEEMAKRDKDALEMWDEIRARAARGEFPKGTDVFLTKYHGLFFVAPAQNAFMCRMRLPGGILRSDQLVGLAELAEKYAGGHADITTRANLQIREIPAKHAMDLLIGLRDLGIVTLGAGADNIRNVTCSPLSGLDANELIETLPLAKELHYHILHRRDLYGLPRKFNIAFDGSGRISSLAETNDVSWHAVDVSQSSELPQGIYFLLGLGGITGHGDFARPTNVVVPPSECVAVSEAILRVFIQHGDRSDRKKARLKYVLDAWGFERFLTEVERELGRPLPRVALELVHRMDRVDRWAHVGVHAQKQPELNYVGVTVPAARLTSDQLRGLAEICNRHASGQIRLTVWQNFLIPNVHSDDVDIVKAAIEALGLKWDASSFHAGLVACTGNAGCKFAASDTKRHSMILADYLQTKFHLDQPVNIHLTGCHHSCAQHALGDIGLIATKVEIEEEMVEGYHILVGGRTGIDSQIGWLLCESIPFTDVPATVATIIQHYLEHRVGTSSFSEFAASHDWSTIPLVDRGLKLTTESASVTAGSLA